MTAALPRLDRRAGLRSSGCGFDHPTQGAAGGTVEFVKRDLAAAVGSPAALPAAAVIGLLACTIPQRSSRKVEDAGSYKAYDRAPHRRIRAIRRGGRPSATQ